MLVLECWNLYLRLASKITEAGNTVVIRDQILLRSRGLVKDTKGLPEGTVRIGKPRVPAQS